MSSAYRFPDRGDLIREAELRDVDVLIGGVEALERGLDLFDAVIWNHVLQHVATAELRRIVAAIRAVLKHNGLLVFCVPLRRTGEPSFQASRVHCGRVVTRSRAQEEFESLVNHSVSEPPIRLFIRAELDTMLMPSFRVLKAWMHCDMRPVRRVESFIFRDHLINLPFLRGRFGSNVLLIARSLRGEDCGFGHALLVNTTSS